MRGFVHVTLPSVDCMAIVGVGVRVVVLLMKVLGSMVYGGVCGAWLAELSSGSEIYRATMHSNGRESST